MITHFYKILNKDKLPIYIGLTTRSINSRFIEHICHKSLNKEEYYVEEIDKIIHPKIDNIKIFYDEYEKVKEKEKFYIKLYGSKYNLLNISAGGEWNTRKIKAILKKEFFNTYGNCDNFDILYKNRQIYIKYINHWIYHKCGSKYKKYLFQWINSKSKNTYKEYIKHWIEHKSESLYKMI